MRQRLHRVVFLLGSIIVVSRGGAQQPASPQPSAPELQAANARFAQSDWTGALAAYEALARRYPTHALSRFRIGVSLLELNRFAEAEASLREAERLGFNTGGAALRLGQTLAEEQRGDEAIAELLRAAQARLLATQLLLENDRHLASLRTHPKWRSVLDAFDAVAHPCMHDDRFRAFDFWVGDWDVRATGLPPTSPAARNTVTLEENGCVVMEHWRAPSGSTGQSFNIFDRSVGKWRQTWVDNSGGQHDYRGERRGADMALVGDTPMPGGQLGRVPTRLTFTRIGPDSVRQYSEVSSDSGRTWQPTYDLMYVRRKPAP